MKFSSIIAYIAPIIINKIWFYMIFKKNLKQTKFWYGFVGNRITSKLIHLLFTIPVVIMIMNAYIIKYSMSIPNSKLLMYGFLAIFFLVFTKFMRDYAYLIGRKSEKVILIGNGYYLVCLITMWIIVVYGK